MTRCKGCHKDTDDETGFCLSCRHTLYTPLQIATMAFRPESYLRPMMFPVRDIIWMQDRMRLLEAQRAQLEEREARIGEAARNLAVERDQARARSAWLWRCLREMRRVRNFYLDHVAKTTKYFRRKGHLMLGFCESVDEILFHEHYSRYDQREDEAERGQQTGE